MEWLSKQADTLLRAADARRRAHAYLISGPAGVGKRNLARWLLRRVLGRSIGPLPTLVERLEGPDAYVLRPESGKSRISVEQIRALADRLALSSHQGGAKAVLIEPADSMTLNAANALLKTLEEPAGDSCLVLVADRLHYVPATILSRCIHLKIPRPEPGSARAWLARQSPGQQWDRALMLAGGAPLKALALQSEGHVELAERLETDFQALLDATADALDVASAWSKADPAFVLAWLIQVTDGLIRHRLTGNLAGPVTDAIARNVSSAVDTKNLFCYLDGLKWLQSQPRGSYNEQLALEALLLAWSRGLPRPDVEAPIMPRAAE